MKLKARRVFRGELITFLKKCQRFAICLNTPTCLISSGIWLSIVCALYFLSLGSHKGIRARKETHPLGVSSTARQSELMQGQYLRFFPEGNGTERKDAARKVFPNLTGLKFTKEKVSSQESTGQGIWRRLEYRRLDSHSTRRKKKKKQNTADLMIALLPYSGAISSLTGA